MQTGTAEKAQIADVDAVIAAIEGGDHARASELARAALDRGDRHPLLLNLRAWWHEGNGRLAAALADLEHAHALAPDDVLVLNALGLCRERLNRPREAFAAFDKATKLAPGFAPAQINRGRTLEALGDFDGAKASYDAALGLGHNAHAELAALAARGADWANARTHARAALAINPALVTAEHVLAQVEIAEGDCTTAKGRLRRILDHASLNPFERASTLSLLGDALDGEGDFRTAFAAYDTGNAARREALAASGGLPAEEPMLVHLQRLADYFGKLPAGAFVAADAGGAGNESGPRHHVFLLGFARSGTTLLEEALATHPDVATTQERDGLREAVAALFLNTPGFDRLMALRGGGLTRYRRSYWETLAAFGIATGGTCLIDKLPYNTVRLPLIAKLFPTARVLFALRDPRDVVLSAFRRRFVLDDSNRPLLTLEGAARYYASVMRLAEVYRATLPLDLMEVRHEHLVDDFAGETARICSYIGIPWTDALATFAGRRRAVMTPSAVQLKEGLSARGVGYWRNYASELAPVLPILAPWVERFGYPAD